MMDARLPEENEDQPVEELSPRLRDAIERIVGDAPPEELVARSLDRARQAQPEPIV